jgi:hypothetical protein
MVSIADVGFGVSQTLPVIVALIAANPQQLVGVGVGFRYHSTQPTDSRGFRSFVRQSGGS